ncbi:conserved hypothetical protein [Mucor ambiguus]|uniref:Autophagy-related protein 11 n=1 Tax=Mucor ambiguus TaxID=91626 RepID=A0A0C9LU03_9FUNG|nr:conserved hypothetical protein [Mucor ambiguus]
MSQELKRQQINALLQQNPSTATVVDGQIYEIPLQTQENTFLLVNLPAHFPEEPPVITLSPTGMRHPWVEGDVIMHDALPSWSQQSNLGALVKDIREEFTKRPPAKKNEQKEDGYSARPPPPIPSASTSSTLPMNPEYSAISKLSPEQMEELLSNETAFDIFFHSLERVKNLRTFQEELLSGNEQLAHKNLSKEDQLLKLRSEVENLHGQFKADKLEFEQKEKLQNEAYNRFSSSTVLTRLKASVYESDELSESVAQSFLDGNLDNDSFKMRIIVAETGHEIELNNPFSKTKRLEHLAQLKQEIETKAQIHSADQILLTVDGAQIKDNTVLEQEQDASTIVLFNRRLLQDPTLVQLPELDLVTTEMIPTLAELEPMIYTCETEPEKEDEIKGLLRDKLTRETSGQAIALEAALFNLESHVKAAYQNFGKFDRIAQREFAKHTIIIDQIANDLQLLVSTSIHPRILIQIKDPQGTTLDTFIPIDLMEQRQEQYTALQKQYHDLAQATMAQRNKVDYLTQQTAHVASTNRTAFEMMVAQVQKLALDSAQAMRGLMGCQKKMGSKQQGRTREALTSLYRYHQVLCDAERVIAQQRQLGLQGFVNCMQHISKVEESVARIYPTLAELEKQMKGLRLNIEKGTSDNLPKRLLLGYGLLLIEVWRRDRYSEIVTKNASLLGDLFRHFGQREERYRQHFNQQLQYLTKQNEPSEQQVILLPFEMQDINDAPVVCKTSATAVYSSDLLSSVINKNQIEGECTSINIRVPYQHHTLQHTGFIQSIQYQDISFQLHRKFNRETKRLNKGLSLLAGLPGGPTMNQKITASIPLSPSTSSTATTTTTDYSIDMKLASPPPSATANSMFHHQKDWELEKASILRQAQEYKNYIEDIHTKHENDRAKFEKDKQSLLRELYSKDKKMAEIKASFELKMEDMEKRIQEAETSHQSELQQLRNQHDHALETEQTTYKRRLSNFYQRINDKDQAITQLEQSLRETKSAPTSPTITSFRLTVSQEQYDKDMARMQDIIDQLKKQPSVDLKSQVAARDQEIEGYKSTIATLEANLKESNAKVAQMTESETRMKQLAVAENAQMMMHAEARVENMTAEHKQSMAELEEEYENEKRVIQIKHQTELDQIKRDMTEKQQTLQEKEKAKIDQEKEAYLEKLAKLESGWQDKYLSAQQQHELQLTRLVNEFKMFKQQASLKQRDLITLQKEQQSAKRIAQDLVSMSSPQQQQQKHLDDVPLIDLLKRTLGNVASLQTKTNVMEQSMDSSYMMSTSYGYY